MADIPNFLDHVQRFIEAKPEYRHWDLQRYAIAPTLSETQRIRMARQGVTGQDLPELVQPLRAFDPQGRLL